jgi:hypothetical protein
MIDPRMYGNPVGMFRMKNKDGTFLFSEEECLRRIGVMLERAEKAWREAGPPEGNGIGKAAGSEPAVWKPTGRGKLFWVNSE